jgi:hypothetical protein
MKEVKQSGVIVFYITQPVKNFEKGRYRRKEELGLFINRINCSGNYAIDKNSLHHDY